METTTCEAKMALNQIEDENCFVPVREGQCPTCGEQTHFIFLGQQRWPEKVAAKLGLPPVMLQWSCERCHTTLSEPEPQS